MFVINLKLISESQLVGKIENRRTGLGPKNHRNGIS